MLKDYLSGIGKSIYALSKESGVAYSTLNDLANGKVEIESCKVGLLVAIADALGLSLDEAVQVCRPGRHAVVTEYGTETNIRVRNKSYFAEFEYGGVRTEIELYRVNEDTTFYINEIAKWRSERYIRDRRMAEWNTSL